MTQLQQIFKKNLVSSFGPDKMLPDKKPSPDMTSCFASEASSGTGATGYTLKTVAPCGFDASVGGTKLGLYQKDTGKISFLPFSFYFWGKGYLAAGVSSNGYLQFPGTNPLVLNNHAPAPLPTAASPNNLVAALWSELKPTTESEVYVATVGQAPKRVYVVQWHVWAAAGTSVPTELTFSVFLYEGTNVIELQYLKLFGGSIAAGGLAAVGIENETGSGGVQHSFLKPDGVSTTYGIRFVPK